MKLLEKQIAFRILTNQKSILLVLAQLDIRLMEGPQTLIYEASQTQEIIDNVRNDEGPD